MTEPLVLVDVTYGVARVRLNRPDKRNALNAALRRALIDALEGLRPRDDVRVIVISGEGKAFAAGADILELNARTVWEQREFMDELPIYEAVARYPKPVIAYVNGLALGAGCELAMACDVRLASSRARLGQPEISLGLIPGGGGTQRLARLIGTGRAARLVLTGEIIDAAKAAEWGLVDDTFPEEEADARVAEVAAAMASKSPLALRLAKEAVRASMELPLAAGLAREVDLFAIAFESDDRREGTAAFLEKRDPSWRGR